jgi:hypothetical protein
MEHGRGKINETATPWSGGGGGRRKKGKKL